MLSAFQRQFAYEALPSKGVTAMKRAINQVLTIAIVIMATYCSAQSPPTVITPSSGKAMCSALTPADFTKAGVAVSALRNANLDGTDGAYCVYESKSGNVEFDIFFPAGANPNEVNATENTVVAEIGAPSQGIPLPGATSAHIALEAGKSACLVARKGSAVFAISIPKNANARTQLLALAQTVLGRIKF
jgi:hypothetical protein